MVLRNFYGWLYSAVVAQRTGGWSEANASILNTEGATVSFASASGNATTAQAHIAKNQSFANIAVQIGSGSVEPAYEDYCLSERITAISNATTSYARVLGNGHAKGVLTYSGTYSGEETVTIREIGIEKQIIVNSSTSATTSVLFTRSLLESPITLKNGDSFVVQTELVLGAAS